jgi:hypothetical protein
MSESCDGPLHGCRTAGRIILNAKSAFRGWNESLIPAYKFYCVGVRV